MSDTRTTSMLRRLPVILAVTAASYGLPYQGHATPRQAATQGGKLSSPAGPAMHTSAELQARRLTDRKAREA